VLLARLRAISRRNLPDRAPRLQIADLVIDPATREAFRSEEKIPLTRTEFSLLEYLMRRPGRVVPRQTLIEAVWGHGSDIESNTLDAFISLVRSKLEASNRKRLIHTVRGVGYCLREEEP
jgi:two-component system, OmpR family, response regulator MprA